MVGLLPHGPVAPLRVAVTTLRRDRAGPVGQVDVGVAASFSAAVLAAPECMWRHQDTAFTLRARSPAAVSEHVPEAGIRFLRRTVCARQDTAPVRAGSMWANSVPSETSRNGKGAAPISLSFVNVREPDPIRVEHASLPSLRTVGDVPLAERRPASCPPTPSHSSPSSTRRAGISRTIRRTPADILLRLQQQGVYLRERQSRGYSFCPIAYSQRRV